MTLCSLAYMQTIMHRPPNAGLGGHHALCPPTLTPVDRNKTYCFTELVLNLPAPLDIQ